jgi:hypothetical protein
MLLEVIDTEISFVDDWVVNLAKKGAAKQGITPKQWITRAIMTYHLEA